MNTASIVVMDGRQATGLDDERKESTLDQSRAMDRFLAEVERRAFRIAQIAVRDSDDAMDIVQDAMIRLVRSYAKRPAAEWKPLFFRILRNRITDHQRRQGVSRRIFAWFTRDTDSDLASDPVADAPARTADRPDRQVAMSDAMTSLQAAVTELPARQQQAFLLRAMEGLDVAATASAMGCSEGSVKTHYSRAVRTLRSVLGDHWP
jgi:RNA polymerase sigma-70 factor (ECF subfamily)